MTADAERITLREYLRTSYRPDCEYVDGNVLERNTGGYDHSRLMGATCAYYFDRRKEWGIEVLLAVRVQISPTRVRVPDVCMVREQGPSEQIIRTSPLICIEILSPRDRFGEMWERISDYLKLGVRYVWILDPEKRQAWCCTSSGMHEVSELRTASPDTVVPLAALFE